MIFRQFLSFHLRDSIYDSESVDSDRSFAHRIPSGTSSHAILAVFISRDYIFLPFSGRTASIKLFLWSCEYMKDILSASIMVSSH